MARFYFLLFVVCCCVGLLDAQSSNEFSISPKSSTVVGNLNLQDLLGNKITVKAPTSVTPYSLTLPGTVSAGCLTSNGSGVATWASCVSLPIDDSLTIIKGSVDATKLLRFEVDGLTTGTTRVATAPDFNFVMAAQNVDNAFSSTQTFNVSAASPYIEVMPNGPSPGFLALKEAPASGISVVGLQAENTLSSNCFYKIGDVLFRPCVDNQIDLGSSSFRWKKAWLYDADLQSGLQVGGNAGFGGTISFSSTMTPIFDSLGSIGTAGLRYGDVFSYRVSASSTFRLGAATTAGWCMISDASAFGTWQPCPGGSIPDATQFTRGAVSTGNQSFGGSKTFYGSILPGSSNTYSNGNAALQWSEVWAVNGQFGSIGASSGGISNLGVNGFLTINTVQGVFPGTGSVGTTLNRIGQGNFTNFSTSQFGSSTIHIGGGDFHNKSFVGSPSCAGRLDGWQGVDTFNLRIWVCIGGTARYAALL